MCLKVNVLNQGCNWRTYVETHQYLGDPVCNFGIKINKNWCQNAGLFPLEVVGPW